MKFFTPLDYILFGFWLAGIAIGLWAPEKVLTQFQVAETYSNLVTTIFPFVKQFAFKSSFPEVALLYHTVLFPSILFFAVWTWRYLKTRKKGLLIKPAIDLRFVDKAVLLIVVFPFFSLLGSTLLFMFTGEDSRLFHIGTSRGHLAIFGVVIPWGAAFFLTIAIASIKKALAGKL